MPPETNAPKAILHSKTVPQVSSYLHLINQSSGDLPPNTVSQGVNTSPPPPDELKITEDRNLLENRMIKSSTALVNQIEEYATDEEEDEEESQNERMPPKVRKDTDMSSKKKKRALGDEGKTIDNVNTVIRDSDLQRV